MATLGMVVASDIAQGLLSFYVKSDALTQTTQDKPLLRELRATMESFPGGKDVISSPVQGQYMSDTPGFLQGYSNDDQLNFNQAQNLLRVAYPWYEVHSGLEIAWTELKKDGITITNDAKQSQHKNAEAVRIVTGLMMNRIQDFGESWARQMNLMCWQNGAQDPKQMPGVLSILTDTPNTGTTGGLDRGANIWWRHRTNLAITASAENQTLTKTLRSEWRQLTRYGGKPTVALCGSAFIDALELEVQDKGLYTQEGFANAGKTNVGMAQISMKTTSGMVRFDYDPTLDDLGFSKRCYMMDLKRLRLRPMEGEDNKLIIPERPYNYMVWFKSMTNTLALECTQLNANGVYQVN